MYLIFVFSNISCSFQLSLSHLTFSFFTRGKDIDIVKMNNIPKRVSCGRDTCTCVSVCPFRFDFHFGFENKVFCIKKNQRSDPQVDDLFVCDLFPGYSTNEVELSPIYRSTTTRPLLCSCSACLFHGLSPIVITNNSLRYLSKSMQDILFSNPKSNPGYSTKCRFLTQVFHLYWFISL